MSWREKFYPETVTLRHWIIVAVFLVVLGMGFWIFIAIKNSSNIAPINEQTADKNIARMATKHDVSRVIPNPSALPVVNKAAHTAPLTNTVTTPLVKGQQFSTSAKAISDDELKAMQAPISQNQIIGQTPNEQTSQLPSHSSLNSPVPNRDESSDQNLQGEKKKFLQENNYTNSDDYLGATSESPVSPYEIQAGTIIPGVLITGVDSDLPGQITGQVREDVYDSISGKYLLIPQGSKLIGLYDSQVAYGQTRVLVAWNRIIFPNGKSIDLKGMPGTDMSGYSGFQDQVDNHYMKIFGSVVLLSILSAGGQLAQPQNQNSSVFSTANPTVSQTLAQSLGTNLANTGTMMTQKNINIQPTLKIRQGYEFNITATKDMVFPGVYAE